MPISSENILQHMAVPQRPGVYQIGCLERRVTLYSQQVRALNLVFALFDLKKLERSSRVAVVGAGAAGLTATVALARQGADVTLLERLDEVIPFQSRSLTRWLHPHIYEWPAEGCLNRNSGLPLLNWSADHAAAVARTLHDEFYRHARESKTIQLQKGVRNVKLHTSATGQRLEWNNAGGGFQSERFDGIVLAVGFGLEGSSMCPVQSYWRNDDLEQFELDADRVRHYLVSGCGDGGLVDLLRIRLRNFQHDQVLGELIGRHPDRSRVESQLLLVEEKARAKAERGEDPSDFLYDEYQRIRPRAVDEKVASRLRGDTRATLNGLDSFPWNLGSSILNRFLASALIGLQGAGHAVGADWWRGKIAHIGQEGGGYRVRLENEEVRSFDRVILRHGPRPAISQWWAQKTSEELIRSRNALDQTRIPAWPEGFFGTPEVPERIPLKRVMPTVHVHVPARGNMGGDRLAINIPSSARVDDLIDTIYFIAVEPFRPPFTYGQTWRLHNRASGLDIVHARELAKNPRFGEHTPDHRSLEDVGILPGDELELVFLEP